MALKTRETQAAETSPDTSREEQRSAREAEQVRRKIESTLRTAASSKGSILQDRDVRDYMKGISEQAFWEGGAKNYAEHLEWLKDNEQKFVPHMLQEAATFASKLREAISKAKAEGGLTKVNEENLERRLTRRDGDWADVKAFFSSDKKDEDTLSAWVKNWHEVSRQLKEVRALKKKVKGAEHLTDVKALETDTFEDGKVEHRLKMLTKALNALTTHEYCSTEAYKTAKAYLRRAVEEGGLHPSKVDGHLQRIFTEYKGEAAIRYIQQTLPGRVSDWIKEGHSFRDLSQKCEKAKVPAPSADEFLSLSYPERRVQLMKMQSALRDNKTPDHHPMLAEIERLLDTEETEKANQMATKTKKMDLSPQDRKKLFDLLQQIRMDRAAGKIEKSGAPDVPKKREELVNGLREVPHDIYLYFSWALKEGGPKKWQRLRRLRVWLYNIKWARDRGFIPNENTYRELKEDSHEDTEKINRDGHRATGIEKIDLGKAKDGVEGVNRKYDGGQSRGPTYVFYDMNDPNSQEQLRESVDDELGNERKNYWGLAGSKKTDLKKTCDSFDKLNPLLKALESAEKGANRAEESIDPGGAKTVASPMPKKQSEAAEPQLATVA